MAIHVPPFIAIASGISYHPSMVKSRKMEYTLRTGLPKYCGAVVPKRNVVMMLNTSNRTINPIATIYEALNANLMPLIRLSIFGMNLSIRKALKARIALSDNKMPVLGIMFPKMFIHEGRAKKTSMKSKRFHPSDQYLENP
jgi:hypothetical protein